MKKISRADFDRILNMVAYQGNYVREDGTQVMITREQVFEYVNELERRLVILACHVADGTSPKVSELEK